MANKKIISIDPGRINNAISVIEVNEETKEFSVEFAEVIEDSDFQNLKNMILALMSMYKIDMIIFEKYSSKKNNFNPKKYNRGTDTNQVTEYIISMKKNLFPFFVHLKNTRNITIMYALPFTNDPDRIKLGWKQKFTRFYQPTEKDIKRRVIEYFKGKKLFFKSEDLKNRCLDNNHIIDSIGLTLAFFEHETTYIYF